MSDDIDSNLGISLHDAATYVHTLAKKVRLHLLILSDESKALAIPAQDGSFTIDDIPHTIATLGDRPPFDGRPIISTAEEMVMSVVAGVEGLEDSKILLATGERLPALGIRLDEVILVIACRISSQPTAKMPWQWMQLHSVGRNNFRGHILEEDAQQTIQHNLDAFMDKTTAESRLTCFPSWEALKKYFDFKE